MVRDAPQAALLTMRVEIGPTPVNVREPARSQSRVNRGCGGKAPEERVPHCSLCARLNIRATWRDC